MFCYLGNLLILLGNGLTLRMGLLFLTRIIILNSKLHTTASYPASRVSVLR